MQGTSNRVYVQRLTELRLRIPPCRVHLDKLMLIARRSPGKRFNLTWCEKQSKLFFRLTVIVRPSKPELWELRCGDKPHHMRLLWVTESLNPSDIYDRIFDSHSSHTRLQVIRNEIKEHQKEYARTLLDGLQYAPQEAEAPPVNLNNQMITARPFA